MAGDTLTRPPVLVVDDDPHQLHILQTWLSHSGYEPTCVPSGFDAITSARRQHFDVVVTDLRMPGMSGLQLLAIFKELQPGAEVIFLTGEGTMHDAIEALREGKAYDFIQKPLRDLSHLNAAIEGARSRARRGDAEVPVTPTAARVTSVSPAPAPRAALTEQEHALLAQLSMGLDNRTIGAALGYSEKTIRNQLTRVYQKLGVESRLQAMARAKEYGITP